NTCCHGKSKTHEDTVKYPLPKSSNTHQDKDNTRKKYCP
ncbi:MAG: hypothetical protein ACI9HU_001652, partial [Colwellia sp.]